MSLELHGRVALRSSWPEYRLQTGDALRLRRPSGSRCRPSCEQVERCSQPTGVAGTTATGRSALATRRALAARATSRRHEPLPSTRHRRPDRSPRTSSEPHAVEGAHSARDEVRTAPDERGSELRAERPTPDIDENSHRTGEGNPH